MAVKGGLWFSKILIAIIFYIKVNISICIKKKKFIIIFICTKKGAEKISSDDLF